MRAKQYYKPYATRRGGLWFDTEECECCGRAVQAANAITLYPKPGQLEKLGTEVWNGPSFPEQYYNEELGICCCERPDCEDRRIDK